MSPTWRRETYGRAFLKEKDSQGNNLKIVTNHMRLVFWYWSTYFSAVKLCPWVAREVNSALPCWIELLKDGNHCFPWLGLILLEECLVENLFTGYWYVKDLSNVYDLISRILRTLRGTTVVLVLVNIFSLGLS